MPLLQQLFRCLDSFQNMSVPVLEGFHDCVYNGICVVWTYPWLLIKPCICEMLSTVQYDGFPGPTLVFMKVLNREHRCDFDCSGRSLW